MTTLIRIGNSKGVRIPKAIIEQAHLNDKELAFKIIDDGLLIQPIKKPRYGWEKQFENAHLASNLTGASSFNLLITLNQSYCIVIPGLTRNLK